MHSATSVKAYYRGALIALRHIEQRQPTGRRFGAEADARWASFRGDLTTADRIDLIIRDADAQWPGAFGPRNVFAQRGVAEDEPFGINWASLDPVDAEEVWRSVGSQPPVADVKKTLATVAACWGLTITDFPVGTIQPADKLLVSGPGAIVAVLHAFSEGQDLDWADQVMIVATPPAHRQLAALGAALLNVAAPTRLLARTDTMGTMGRPHVVISDDGDSGDVDRVRACGAAK